MIKIGIDASGGDFGYQEIVKGAFEASQSQKFSVVVYGKPEVMPESNSFFSVENAKPHQELKLAFQDLKSGHIQAILTASNSKRLLAAARPCLQVDVKRPALIAPIPTKNGLSYLMDAGATAKVIDPEVFLGWAIAGRNFLHQHRQIGQPRIALQNIATERACPEIAAIHKVLVGFDGYVGYAEPADFFAGKVDLWLTDGFTGNSFLKLLEEVLPFCLEKAGAAIRDFPVAVGCLKNLASRLLSYDAHLVSPLLGVHGWVFRVHGCVQAEQIAKAFEAASKYLLIRSF